ncbi:hypothetical protein [Glaciimonas soli]|uniref:Uncharacterized protein n=1 Tax=Glaciimonas soli TaxID=2590999 RepID=A0A843YSV9_9BURK|nr:hypothetical protein [Glaciimonas soli]MQQ99765.1 hypothetical protein [Glaciimonas soli]
MQTSSLKSLVFCLFAAMTGTAISVPLQTESSFKSAVENSSEYAIFTVIDDRTGHSRTGCACTNFLRGAFHIEYEIGYTSEESKKVVTLILSHTDRTYHFTNPKAIANIPFYYSEKDVETARSRLEGMSNQQLREFVSSKGDLESLRQTASGSMENHNARRDSTICALIERGFSAGTGDRTDRIWIK